MKRNYCELKTILEAEQALYLRHTKPLSLEKESSECASTASHINQQVHLPLSYYSQSSSLGDQYVELTEF